VVTGTHLTQNKTNIRYLYSYIVRKLKINTCLIKPNKTMSPKIIYSSLDCHSLHAVSYRRFFYSKVHRYTGKIFYKRDPLRTKSRCSATSPRILSSGLVSGWLFGFFILLPPRVQISLPSDAPNNDKRQSLGGSSQLCALTSIK